MRHSGSFFKISIMSLAAVTLLSALGAYGLSRVIYGVNEDSQAYAQQLLVIDESLDDASITLGRQIQEWKDMLMRASDNAAYSKHQKGFVDASVGVQYALLRTKTAMQGMGMDTGKIDRLAQEHKNLLANYVQAHARLKPKRLESSHEVDRLVVGVDRDLQQHFAAVRADIALQTRNQLQAAIPARGKRYLLTGLLGASLLFMALFGFALASLLHLREKGLAAH